MLDQDHGPGGDADAHADARRHADADADPVAYARDVRVPAQHHRQVARGRGCPARSAGWTYIIYGDLTTGTKNKIQAQSPDHNHCTMKSTVPIVAHYRPGA